VFYSYHYLTLCPLLSPPLLWQDSIIEKKIKKYWDGKGIYRSAGGGKLCFSGPPLAVNPTTLENSFPTPF
jgi:hypothetical protein